MAWSDAARAASRAARKARKSFKPGADKSMRKIAVRFAIQRYRDKLWKKSLANSRSDAQVRLNRPKWAMSAKDRR